MRLDQLLVARGLFASRSRARDAILRRTVRLNGEVVIKPGQNVAAAAAIVLDDPAQYYVSRAALKLVAACEHFPFQVSGKQCLDIGASTGGFTQVLLERGAVHVVAIDVGHGQLHPTLRGHESITLLEGLNARNLAREHLDGRAIDVIVSDVSFISLKLALPPALALARDGAQGLFLVKPQFEAGRDALGSDGLLKDKKMGEKIADDLSRWLKTQRGWRACGFIASPISGGKGAQEFLLYGVKEGG